MAEKALIKLTVRCTYTEMIKSGTLNISWHPIQPWGCKWIEGESQGARKRQLHELLYTEIWKSETFRLASEHGSNPKPHVISEFEMSENMDSGVQCTSTYHVCLCPSINLYFKICWQSVSFLFALLTDVELYTARSWKCPNQNFNLKKMFQITFLNEKRHKPNYFLNLL